MLLAATGGFLDAFVYLNHGHVFANAMTGNVVLLGIALVGHPGSSLFASLPGPVREPSPPRFGNHTLWIVEPLLLTVLVLAILRKAAPGR